MCGEIFRFCIGHREKTEEKVGAHRFARRERHDASHSKIPHTNRVLLESKKQTINKKKEADIVRAAVNPYWSFSIEMRTSSIDWRWDVPSPVITTRNGKPDEMQQQLETYKWCLWRSASRSVLMRLLARSSSWPVSSSCSQSRSRDSAAWRSTRFFFDKYCVATSQKKPGNLHINGDIERLLFCFALWESIGKLSTWAARAKKKNSNDSTSASIGKFFSLFFFHHPVLIGCHFAAVRTGSIYFWRDLIDQTLEQPARPLLTTPPRLIQGNFKLFAKKKFQVTPNETRENPVKTPGKTRHRFGRRFFFSFCSTRTKGHPVSTDAIQRMKQWRRRDESWRSALQFHWIQLDRNGRVNGRHCVAITRHIGRQSMIIHTKKGHWTARHSSFSLNSIEFDSISHLITLIDIRAVFQVLLRHCSDSSRSSPASIRETKGFGRVSLIITGFYFTGFFFRGKKTTSRGGQCQKLT